MITLSVTRSRVRAVLRQAANLLEEEGWDPALNPLVKAIDRASGFVAGFSSRDAEDTSLASWDAVCAHLGGVWLPDWEQQPGRTQADVVAALRAATTAVTL